MYHNSGGVLWDLGKMPGMMLTRIFSTWLTAAILLCPYVCSGGVLCGNAERESQQCSCCHQSAPMDNSRPDEPIPSEQPSGGTRQCICGGAVLEDMAQFDAAPLVASLLDLLPVPAIASASDVAPSVFLSGTPPTCSMNPGRELCCLYSTFLC
jgi:hypothetical protein